MSNKKILQGHNKALESLATIAGIPLAKEGLYVWSKSNYSMNWTQSNITSGSFNSVYYGDGLWVAGGSGLYYSVDGKTWTQSNITSGVMRDFYSVYYTNGIWIAGGNSGLWHSTDGKVWTQSNVTEGYFYSVYYGNGLWVAGCDDLYYFEPTLIGYIVGDNESDYPDKAVQDGYYYEKVLPPVNPSENI